MKFESSGSDERMTVSQFLRVHSQSIWSIGHSSVPCAHSPFLPCDTPSSPSDNTYTFPYHFHPHLWRDIAENASAPSGRECCSCEERERERYSFFLRNSFFILFEGRSRDACWEFGHSESTGNLTLRKCVRSHLFCSIPLLKVICSSTYLLIQAPRCHFPLFRLLFGFSQSASLQLCAPKEST